MLLHEIAARMERQRTAVAQLATVVPSESDDGEMACLDRCLEELDVASRVLILDYYEGERRGRQTHRREMAERLGIGPNALRIRLHRIRRTLEGCLLRCLGDRETNGAPPSLQAGGRDDAYLLGGLPAEEAEALEELYFNDESVFEDVVLAEDDLIDEYLDGELPDDSRRVFEGRLQERPELMARLDARRRLTRALRRRVDSREIPRVGTRQIILGLAAAAAALFVSVRAFQDRPAAPHRVPVGPSVASGIAAPRASGETTAPSAPMVLLLGAGGVREKSSVPTVTIEPPASVLRLALPVRATSVRTLDVVIEDVDRGEVWKGPGRVTMDGSRAETDVPVSELAPGDYIVRFRGLPGGDEEAFFRVQR
jgi:hypothetical protein